jgi:hypothetical protein
MYQILIKEFSKKKNWNLFKSHIYLVVTFRFGEFLFSEIRFGENRFGEKPISFYLI